MMNTEMGQSKAAAEFSFPKKNLESAVKTKMAEFSVIINGALKDKKDGAGLSPAEAEAVRKEILGVNVGGDLIRGIKAEDHYDTKKIITIPMDTGDATFKLSVFRDPEQSKFKFQLEAVNDLAKRLESN